MKRNEKNKRKKRRQRKKEGGKEIGYGGVGWRIMAMKAKRRDKERKRRSRLKIRYKVQCSSRLTAETNVLSSGDKQLCLVALMNAFSCVDERVQLCCSMRSAVVECVQLC